MTANASLEYPDDLKASTWEKDRKSGFDAKSELAAKLKALQKKHDAVDWKLFADGWTHAEACWMSAASVILTALGVPAMAIGPRTLPEFVSVIA